MLLYAFVLLLLLTLVRNILEFDGENGVQGGSTERRKAMECCLLSVTERAVNDVQALCVHNYGISPSIVLDKSQVELIEKRRDLQRDLELGVVGKEDALWCSSGIT